MAPLVDLRGLRYTYPDGGGRALDAVDLALDGGLCVVAGASGGGKSTLLRVLNGLVPHMHGGRVSGRAIVADRDVLHTPTRAMATSVGFVFQDAERQAVHATVARDIAFGLENMGTEPDVMRRRVGDVMVRLGIEHLRDRTISSLSGGERQRVAVAGALVLHPRLLVLDEPLSQLDATGARALLELCIELRDQGTCVVVSEHRLDDLLPLGDSVVAIAGGRVSGPAASAQLAGTLESAPQLVRLSAAMGWTPPVLDPAVIRPLLSSRMPDRRVASHTPQGALAWQLEGVVAGHQQLLRDVSCAGRHGEVVAVMGRNGSGKTTLLRIIAGLLTPQAGRVWRDGGRAAYLPQNPAALLHRESLAAEIAWTMRAEGGDDGELVQTLGLRSVADRDPRDLSSGQRQRAAVAAILCGSPSLALLDEPTRGMDSTARSGLVSAIRSLTARGAAVVIATHDSELAANADRVLVIVDGEVHDRGAPSTAVAGASNEHATQLGRLFEPPGYVTVDAVAALLSASQPSLVAP